MTEPIKKSTLSGGSLPRQNVGRIAFCLMSTFLFALLLRNAEFAIGHMSDGLRLCVRTVIPSLFPFMVLSELLVATGAAELIGKMIPHPIRRLFGIGRDGCCAVLLGLLCGSPIGAKSAVSLYRAGRIDRAELTHLLTFSNTPSSAFLISAVGVSLFGDRTFGTRLYLITLLSALLTGILGARLRGKASPSEMLPKPSQNKTKHATEKETSVIRLFTGAITSSALSILYVCAFVVFFSAFVGTIESMLQAFSLPPSVTALCYGLFELTGGVARAASCTPPAAEYLCAFLAGWSGLSVHCQIMSLCADSGVSFRPYLLAKLAQGLLNIPLLFLANAILP
ncbi:MAG: hypothetical protein E7668_06935 [Ruminococcaceae bacterium]|nr:hypothetical protein [Oscillospiraceae bacterium]